MFARLKRWYMIWIVDDRGAERPLVKLRRFRRSEVKGWFVPQYAGPHSGRAEEFATSIKMSLWEGKRLLFLVPLWLLMFGSRPLLNAVMGGANASIGSAPRWVFELTYGAIFFAFLFAIVHFDRRVQRLRAKDRLRSAYLLSSHCPSCDTSLEGLPPEADGCVVCPTCSAAWKASAVGPQMVAEPEVRAILPGTRGELSWTNPESANPTVGNPA